MISIKLKENNLQDFEKELSSHMNQAIVHFEKECSSIRTGKADTRLIENVKVECYGNSVMILKEIASLNAPDTNILTVQPWDKSIIQNIEKAINIAHLGLSPQIDGDIIRIELPKITQARREELIKLVNKKIEEAKISLRKIRQDFLSFIKSAEKNKEISEDFSERLSKSLQNITDKFNDKIETTGTSKKNSLKL